MLLMEIRLVIVTMRMLGSMTLIMMMTMRMMMPELRTMVVKRSWQL